MIHEVEFVTHSLLRTGAVKRIKKGVVFFKHASVQSFKPIQEDNDSPSHFLPVIRSVSPHGLPRLHLLLICFMGQLHCFFSQVIARIPNNQLPTDPLLLSLSSALLPAFFNH